MRHGGAHGLSHTIRDGYDEDKGDCRPYGSEQAELVGLTLTLTLTLTLAHALVLVTFLTLRCDQVPVRLHIPSLVAISSGSVPRWQRRARRMLSAPQIRRPSTAMATEQGAVARQMYLDGVPVADIRVATGMTDHWLYYWFKGGPPASATCRRCPAGAARMAARRAAGGSPATGWRWSAGSGVPQRAQVRDIEERLSRHAQQPDDRERDARTLAVLVKTMRELAALDYIKECFPCCSKVTS